MMRFSLFFIICPIFAHAGTPSSRSSFVEERQNKNANPFVQMSSESRSKAEMEQLFESSRTTYLKYHNRLRVPGFISATPLPQLAKIVGPRNIGSTSFRVGDTIYIRWSGAPMPKIGDRYSTFTPAIVLQNLAEPTDFEIFLPLGPGMKLPSERRMAGYFYDTTGRIKVIRIKGGLVEAYLEKLSGHVTVGDELMETPPLLENITPINSGVQLSAAVVCGSPHDRLSTTKRSIIYINRGSRDGIRVGRVFESVESVRLDESVSGAAPEVSNGEAIVIHTTDAYSTAMITKQFDVIRMGSLLRTKQEENPVTSKSPFEGYSSTEGGKKIDEKLPEVPSTERIPEKMDTSLPEPRSRPSPPALSDLDEMERRLKIQNLSPEEKTHLDKLSRQEKIGSTQVEEMEDTAGAAGSGSLENSFKDGKTGSKKDGKKAKKKAKNDEEELNLLMMQN